MEQGRQRGRGPARLHLHEKIRGQREDAGVSGGREEEGAGRIGDAVVSRESQHEMGILQSLVEC